jgi:hypothetical protein
VVQEALGHSSLQLTLDTYSHLLSDMGLKERAAARLEALLTAPAHPPVEPVEENPGQNPGQNGVEVVSQTFTSWNRIAGWLRRIGSLRAAA